MLGAVPDHLKARWMCNKAVDRHLYLLRYVPNQFVTREWVDMWHDDYCDDDGDHWNDDDDEDKYCEWYDGYKKRKA